MNRPHFLFRPNMQLLRYHRSALQQFPGELHLRK